MTNSQKESLKITIILLVVIVAMVYLGVRNSPDSIHNTDNQPFVLEVAFNEGVTVDKVTQGQFNKRYLNEDAEN